jgi:hypothetical protein
MVVVGILLLVTIGIVVILVNNEPDVPETPVEMAEAFMAAMNEHDADAVISLLADRATVNERSLDALVGEIEQEAVLGWTYDVERCVQSESTVRCDYTFSNDLTRALGTGPYAGSVYRFTVADGQISTATNIEFDGPFQDETLAVFLTWMEENHPEVGSIYYQYDTDNGPENLALWEQYLPEFVAAVEASG